MGAALALGACEPRESAAENNVAEPAPNLPGVPLPEPPLNREQLLLAALRSASDFSAGVDDSQRQRGLAEKRFEFRIRFGCEGPAERSSNEPFSWTLNESTRALRVRATPMLSMNDPAVAAIAGDRFEGVEGFWVRRPWLLAPACPKAEPQPEPQEEGAEEDSEPVAPPPPKDAEQAVAIAQFFTATESRTRRRSGRPYEATMRLDEGEPPAGGFDLVLTGRLSALPDGRVILCTGQQAGGRPSCVISVEFERVAIERADTREELAHWRSG